jgi:hypothetical protein
MLFSWKSQETQEDEEMLVLHQENVNADEAQHQEPQESQEPMEGNMDVLFTIEILF